MIDLKGLYFAPFPAKIRFDSRVRAYFHARVLALFGSKVWDPEAVGEVDFWMDPGQSGDPTGNALIGDPLTVVISTPHFSTQKEACRCPKRDGRVAVSH